jgi:RNA polymerase sigma-70 factor (ECF subfamily)
VRKATSISSAGRPHSSHTVRSPFGALPPEKARRAPFEVLHCPPLHSLRGNYLQFQSFDASYVERLRADDFRTQDHFVAYFTELIQIKLRSRLKLPQAIEDGRQETFARFFSALRAGNILQLERLGSFANSICNNVLLDHHRSPSACNDWLYDENGRGLPAKGIDMVSALAAQQTEKKVREILEQLSECDRRLLREIFSKNAIKTRFAVTSVSIVSICGSCCTVPSSRLNRCTQRVWGTNRRNLQRPRGIEALSHVDSLPCEGNDR